MNDFRDFPEFPRRSEWPSSSLGRWSLGLAAGFIILASLLAAMVSRTPNDAILNCTVAAAIGSGLAAGVAAIVAITRMGERSILMVLPLIMGGIATIFAFAVLG